MECIGRGTGDSILKRSFRITMSKNAKQESMKLGEFLLTDLTAQTEKNLCTKRWKQKNV
ncbi:hypothetical protein BTS2_2695 [Bacillus sp. TS-2]|nr:hypothetical protein BTS2_2695 [Bacillus sp. TS-2]